jgi:amidase
MSTFTLRLADAGPIPGVTRVAVKDIIDMGGLVTTSGSKVLAARSEPALVDAACLTGVRAAEAEGRALIVGRTNLHELAYGVSGVNLWFGTPVNPLDRARVPGGSSSGSAVAVADGDADVAFGTDTGGSIRIPAACCGVAGLKTTFGRISVAGVRALGPTLDTVGPMGADVAAVAEGMTLLEPGFSFAGLTAATWVDGAIDEALAVLGSSISEVEVTEIDLPGWSAATDALAVVLAAEAWAMNGELWESAADQLSPDVAARLEAGSRLDPAVVSAARETARAWAAELEAIWENFDLIALPVLAEEPPRIADAARVTEIRYTGPFNLAGGPALALPVPAPTRFPASLQLAGPHGSEELLLATGAAIEQAVR